MSAIDKKPFIIRALETLSSEQLIELKRLINGGISEALTGGNFRSLINPDYYVTEDDVGIHEITLEISRNRAQNLYKGYLVYNIVSEVEYYCFLIYYSTPDQQTIGIVKIEPNGPHSTYLFCNPLTILELRSEINDILGVGEADIERYIENDKKVLEKVVFDTEAGTTTFPKYILPLKIIVRRSGGTFTSLFFDYESGYVINNSGSQTEITVEEEDQSVVVNSTSWSNKMMAIEYISFNGGLGPSVSGLNAYNLYHASSGNSPKIYDGGSDVTALSSEIVEQLQAGDIVKIASSSGDFEYAVASISETEKIVQRLSDNGLYRCIYLKNDNVWYYDDETTSHFGSKLYCHNVMLSGLGTNYGGWQFYLYFISSSNELINSYTKIFNNINKCVNAVATSFNTNKVCMGPVFLQPGSSNYPSLVLNIYDKTTSTITSVNDNINTSNTRIVTDIVTEL